MNEFSRVFLHVDPVYPDAFFFAIGINGKVTIGTDGLFVLGNLIPLGKIGIKVIFPGKNAFFTDTAVERKAQPDCEIDDFLLRTGSAPGNPIQVGQVWLFGSAPKVVEQPQNILLFVKRWACTSSPITPS